MIESSDIVEGQLRECYGRVVYTHKTQEVCADLLHRRNNWIKGAQIALSALVTGGILATLADSGYIAIPIISAVLSTALLALNAYTKEHDLGEIAQKHRQAAADIWLIREQYLNLLIGLRSGILSVTDACTARDKLQVKLHALYEGAPRTNLKAYQQAQKALKLKEDMTFSEQEVDVFLPNELKRTPMRNDEGSHQ